jgi:release factor glutamine methyltransferase
VPDDVPVAPEVRADPHDAVFAGPDGLALLPAVISCAAELLRPGGWLAVEHHDTHGPAVLDLLVRDERWADAADHHDLAGRPRYATARRSADVFNG